jgi:LuxR family maltose regulon positive regulatory protein
MAQAGRDETPTLLAAAITRVTHAEALLARNELNAAEATLAEAIDHCRRQLGLPEHVIRGGFVLARCRLARGDEDGAREAFERAEALMQANLAERPQFDRLLWSALLHRAHYLARSGQRERVMAWLESAEHLMVSEERRQTAATLREHAKAAPATASGSEAASAEPGKPPAATPDELFEVLNDRERSLLRLMEAGMTNAEIASELYLSVHTVKWHARNLFSKLDVRNRTTAIARARELGLL